MSEPGYFVSTGSAYLHRRPYDGRMYWNASTKDIEPMSKAKAEWFCEILRTRAIEDAHQCEGATVVADYYGRDAGQLAMPRAKSFAR